MTPGPGSIFGVGFAHCVVNRLTAAALKSLFRPGEETMTSGFERGYAVETQSKSTSIADKMPHSKSEVW